jgi:hypothetical protein
MNDILHDKKLIEKINVGIGVEMAKNVRNILESSDVDYSSRRNNDQHPNPPYLIGANTRICS